MSRTTTEKILRLIFAVLAIAYAAMMIKFVVLRGGIRLIKSELRMVPFSMIKEYAEGERSLPFLVINYVGNIAMFIPFGLLLAGIFKKLDFIRVFIIGFILILIIETLQYFTASGYADIDDVILNTTGVIIGDVICFGAFGGKSRSIASYVLSLSLIAILAVSSIVSIWYYRPDMLPKRMVVYNHMIGGNSIERYDMRAVCYHMSHGEVFIYKNTATDNSGYNIEDADGAYPITDTAIFVQAENAEDGVSYDIVGIDEIIKSVTVAEESNVRLWFNAEGECRMILLETTHC